ncbi:ABC transporter ATP-binding protein [Pantanalinema sp. GBBB05]|uniref:ABC transporter ATP-binding protein n=1 Tax=Pantanalinema sp. GBBB05 TaxID=2604139 RepID=UPI001D6E3FD7|nr:ABC transporter ATP-binding protein [Pantanalinema sp. GBBB05]
MTESVILQVEGLTKQFSPTLPPAIHAISCQLPTGALLSLLGASGCGKTTLLRLIAGFERPQSGSIILNGQLVANPDRCVAPEHRDIGMVFQDYALFPHLTVAKNVAFGLVQPGRKRGRCYSAEQIRKLTAEAISLVGLAGLEHRYPHQLSGGQQQRVALARALAPRPSLILLDEPLSNLDMQVRLRLRQEVRDILKTTGTTAIFVTHDQEEALSISDYVAVMRQGQIEQFGTPETIYQEPASRFVAEFVTQANFLPARFNGKGWETEVGCFETKTQLSASRNEASRSRELGELMVRPEDLRLEPDEMATVVIRDRQFLGREHRYCLLTPSGKELHARIATRTALPIGTRVRLSAAAAALRVFPASTPGITPSLVGYSAD